MTPETVLEELGLSEGERKTYLALLTLGESPVADIKEETGLHRTTIYDFLESLEHRGLASHVEKSGVRHYTATHPHKLLDIVEQQALAIKDVLPELAALAEEQRGEIHVEVHRGREGMKTLLSNLLQWGEGCDAFGIDDTEWERRFPHLMAQYFREQEQLGYTDRLLTKDTTKFQYPDEYGEYRYIPEEYFTPTPTLVYGNRVTIVIWEPFTTITIQNEDLATGYRKHFELLWSMAAKRKEGDGR